MATKEQKEAIKNKKDEIKKLKKRHKELINEAYRYGAEVSPALRESDELRKRIELEEQKLEELKNQKSAPAKSNAKDVRMLKREVRAHQKDLAVAKIRSRKNDLSSAKDMKDVFELQGLISAKQMIIDVLKKNNMTLEEYHQKEQERKARNKQIIKSDVQRDKAEREYQESLKKEEFKVVDVKDYINELGEKDKEVKQYQKFQKVNAVQGEPGQEVVTKMANGLEETKNVVKIDEKTGEPGWIVTNPSGEQYIVEDSKFTARYDVENAKNGVYEPKFEPIKAIEVEDNITFTAPWGEKMNIAKGGYLVINSPDDIYGIQKEEFFETYQELNQYLENKKQQEKAKSRVNDSDHTRGLNR